MKTNKTPIPSNNLPDCPIQVSIATQSWEKREIYRLRYEVYIQEMAKPLGSKFSKNKQLCDSLDNRSILLYAQAGGDIAATMRLTIATAEDYSADLAEVFLMHKSKVLLSHLPNPRFGLGTKLAVKAKYRHSPALYLIITEAYRLLRENKVQLCFTGCNPSLIPLYERMGFRKFAGNFTDPGYGLLVSLVMVVEDIDYFQAVKSPLYRHIRKYTNDLTIAQRFSQAFPEISKHPNTQLVTRKILWEYVQRKLSTSPALIPTFKNIDKVSIGDLLLAGVIFHCAPGDYIIYQHSVCDDLYILISGSLLATSQAELRTLHPGDHFGGFTLTNQIRQMESVSAKTESDVFVLPRQAFTRYQRLHQQAAEILLNNLTSIPEFAYACASLTNQGGQNHE